METLLVAQGIAEAILPPLCRIYLEKGIELRGDAAARRIVPQMNTATEQDWHTEYLAAILSVRVVSGLDAAIEHIATYGSQHTDAIVTEDITRARRFLAEVDSSSVMVNASTRFADGYEYGLGAEIGISTDKLHARGPVGLEGLTSLKWVVYGSGQGEFTLPFFPLIVKNVTMRFFIVYKLGDADRERALSTLTGLMERGVLQHLIAQRLPLAQIAMAHELVESGRAIGNVVISLP